MPVPHLAGALWLLFRPVLAARGALLHGEAVGGRDLAAEGEEEDLASASEALSLLQLGARPQAGAVGVRRSRGGPRSSNATYRMADGRRMPVIGLGTYRIPPGNNTYSSVLAALELGYRMVDTAEMYGNEADVGRAIRDSGVPRSQVFVATKIWNSDHQYDLAIDAGLKSNETLGLGYIDLLLMHSPAGRIVETYDAMVRLRDMGVARSIGVSNFGVRHLEALREACRPTPAVNQFELHPLNFRSRADLVEYCRNSSVLVQAYGSVLSGHEDLLSKAGGIAAAHNRTEAQVMLRWALDKGFQVIPKSTHADRLAEDLDVFDFRLTAAEIEDLDGLPQVAIQDYWDPLAWPVDPGDTSHGGC